MTPVAAESWEYYDYARRHNIETLPVFSGFEGPVTLEEIVETGW